jgi:hypothetical protein
MSYVTGECCATALIQAGLSRRDVVAALERELGLTDKEACAAWLHVTLHQGEIPAIRRVVSDLDRRRALPNLDLDLTLVDAYGPDFRDRPRA